MIVLQEIRNAYDARDRDALENVLARIEALLRYTGPVPPLLAVEIGPLRTPDGCDLQAEQP